MEPAWGVASKVASVTDEEEDDAGWSSGMEIDAGASNHLTVLSCFSDTESKQMGQRAHLLSDVLR
jgi:hypothetical protein